jgi:hypothetical protein
VNVGNVSNENGRNSRSGVTRESQDFDNNRKSSQKISQRSRSVLSGTNSITTGPKSDKLNSNFKSKNIEMNYGGVIIDDSNIDMNMINTFKNNKAFLRSQSSLDITHSFKKPELPFNPNVMMYSDSLYKNDDYDNKLRRPNSSSKKSQFIIPYTSSIPSTPTDSIPISSSSITLSSSSSSFHNNQNNVNVKPVIILSSPSSSSLSSSSPEYIPSTSAGSASSSSVASVSSPSLLETSSSSSNFVYPSSYSSNNFFLKTPTISSPVDDFSTFYSNSMNSFPTSNNNSNYLQSEFNSPKSRSSNSSFKLDLAKKLPPIPSSKNVISKENKNSLDKNLKK